MKVEALRGSALKANLFVAHVFSRSQRSCPAMLWRACGRPLRRSMLRNGNMGENPLPHCARIPPGPLACLYTSGIRWQVSRSNPIVKVRLLYRILWPAGNYKLVTRKIAVAWRNQEAAKQHP